MGDGLGFSLPFPEDKLEEYADIARRNAHLCGLVKLDPASGATVASTLTLLPTPVPGPAFHQLCLLQPAYTRLYHHVAHDFNFLRKHLKPIAEMDDFVARLWRIHEAVRHQPAQEHRCLMLGRNDFMLDPDQPKQIEFNTIAAAGAGKIQRSRDFHNWTIRDMGHADMAHKFPAENHDNEFAAAMIECVRAYDSPGSVILFVVEKRNYNLPDQLVLAHLVYQLDPAARILIRSLEQLEKTSRVDGQDRLFVGEDEVALVYYRTGYGPENYRGQMDWDTRLRLEKSRAFLGPCIHTQLAGCKKIQQVLCNPGVVERYISDPATARNIRQTFAQQYPTDQTPAGDRAVELARSDPDKYILKPQREGGGSKLFGRAIVEELDRLGASPDRGKYVLMERVFPPIHDNYIVSHNTVKFGNTVSEIGMFVASIWHDEESHARFCGDYLRTKMSDQNEGGINAGGAGRDTIYLV